MPLKQFIREAISRPSTQPVFSQLLKLCHAGLNYGGGQTVAFSGEVGALKSIIDSRKDFEIFTVFDVGANGGDYARCATDLLGERVRAYLFEPQSSSMAGLSKRFASDPRIVLRKVALGSELGTGQLFAESDGSVTATLYPTAGSSVCETIEITTLDLACRELSVDSIDLLKIDTEGHEVEVLRGASQMLTEKRIRAVQFEFGDMFVQTPYHFKDLWELLSPAYHIHRILRHGLVKIAKYHNDLEIYKCANFLCILKP